MAAGSHLGWQGRGRGRRLWAAWWGHGWLCHVCLVWGEPASGLVPLVASWGEQGEERRIWELYYLLWAEAGQGILKLGVSLQNTPFQ